MRNTLPLQDRANQSVALRDDADDDDDQRNGALQMRGEATQPKCDMTGNKTSHATHTCVCVQQLQHRLSFSGK